MLYKSALINALTQPIYLSVLMYFHHQKSKFKNNQSEPNSAGCL